MGTVVQPLSDFQHRQSLPQGCKNTVTPGASAAYLAQSSQPQTLAILCQTQNVASREQEAHRRADPLVLAAARSQHTGQADTPPKVNLSPVPCHLLVTCYLNGGASQVVPPPIHIQAVRRRDRHRPLFLHQTLLALKQVRSPPLSGHKGKPQCRGQSCSTCERREVGPTLLPARIPSVSKASLRHDFSIYPWLWDLEACYQALGF